jgi:hypothetical protein
LKILKLLAVMAMVLLGVSIVRADDTVIHVNPDDTPPGLSPCGSNLIPTPGGVINFTCVVTSVASGGTGPLTVITTEASNAGDGGALTAVSQLVTVDGWTLTETDPAGIDTFTLTAPTHVTLQTYLNLLATGDPYFGGPTINTFLNDGDCDLDDFVLGIPVGCVVNLNNFLNGVSGETSPYTGSAIGLAGNNDPLPALPEPGTLPLLLIGLTGVPFVRRKFAR